jgi:predicted dehydrogenase
MQDSPPIRVGLIGCGGRGTGAAENCLESAPNIELTAMGDLFPDALAKSRATLAAKKHKGFKVADERVFTGFDAYRRVLDAGVDLVLLTTPPGFRPLHFRAAIEAGKHVFFEKPVAVDPAGVRTVIEWGEKAREKKLAVVAGTQYRHSPRMIETMRQIHGGRIGRILSVRSVRHGGYVWEPKPRQPDWSDMEYQIRNWYYYTWLSGDFIAEMHIHQIDLVNWALEAVPQAAVAVGGRQQRADPKYGQIYDHIAVDYEYPGGIHALHIGRQMQKCANHTGVYVAGEKGTAIVHEARIEGEHPWSYPKKEDDVQPTVQEHADLVASIRSGRPLNEARRIAESTLTTVLGREVSYTGKRITWEEILGSPQDLLPANLEFGPLAEPPVPIPRGR